MVRLYDETHPGEDPVEGAAENDATYREHTVINKSIIIDRIKTGTIDEYIRNLEGKVDHSKTIRVCKIFLTKAWLDQVQGELNDYCPRCEKFIEYLPPRQGSTKERPQCYDGMCVSCCLATGKIVPYNKVFSWYYWFRYQVIHALRFGKFDKGYIDVKNIPAAKVHIRKLLDEQKELEKSKTYRWYGVQRWFY